LPPLLCQLLLGRSKLAGELGNDCVLVLDSTLAGK
jgi:hypothetical protein